MLNAQDIHVTLDGQPILAIDHITLPYGQINVLAGPSGAGKSTFLHLISGQLAPQKGTIHWQEQDLFKQSETVRSRWRSQQVGFIFQDFHLIPSLSALDNVVLQHSFYQWRVSATQKQQATKLLQQFGVENIHKNISQFSRGEKQRIALARALAGNPAIILADEPTASLDQDNALFVIEQLKQQAQEGKFVLIVSHDALVLEHADQIIYLDRGEVKHESLDAA